MPWIIFLISKVDKLKMPRGCQPVNQAIPKMSFSLPYAVKAVEVLCITLTVRHYIGRMITVFPHHALNTYFPKIIRAGL